MQGMTRRERQVTDPERILQILDTAKVLHLGLAVDNEPYVVPMNYGYAMVDGKLTLYLHSAHRGKKLDMMRANPNVFFEMESGLVPFEGDVACRYGLAYSCLMGRGQAQKVEEMLSPDYFRWLYTAFTRATETLYLVNWPKEQLED